MRLWSWEPFSVFKEAREGRPVFKEAHVVDHMGKMGFVQTKKEDGGRG